ncbi:hypothetical protein [Rubrimonas cliftonensis]|uniref:Transcription regulator HTH AraC- type ligand binding domain-containing protein n=1 Tax=Rubrimonas cliftonensis TaxID=89524 RepID=A0A1H4FPY7_9RHOB|nr:hypothetical protein [Rubrimonas cliftonensis]SEA99429.1 hypothetical protein SAMN05444370_12636 [Rubrimonas cliftonensis]
MATAIRWTPSSGARIGVGELLARVDAFCFTGRAPQTLHVTTLALGALAIGRVRSSGHEIALAEPDRVSFIAPLRGAIRTEARGRALDARADETLYLREGPRRTEVVPPAAGGAYAAAIVLAPAPRRPGAAPPRRARVGAGLRRRSRHARLRGASALVSRRA